MTRGWARSVEVAAAASDERAAEARRIMDHFAPGAAGAGDKPDKSPVRAPSTIAACKHVWDKTPGKRRAVERRKCRLCRVTEFHYVLNGDGKVSVRNP
jgi:hypothetical protein